jgi:ferric-dicitrate binding protein FerR (iron transport regulator)
MAEGPMHEPKLAALRAYANGALRPAGRARLERHLETCATCSEALLGFRRFQVLAAAANDASKTSDDLPAIDWQRMESALRSEEARARRRKQLQTIGWIGAGLAAATWLAIALQPRAPQAEREVPRPVRPEQAQQPAPSAPQLQAVLTAIVGTPQAIDQAHGSTPLTLTSRPLEGWTLETGPGSEVHIALAETGAFVLRENSRLVLRVLRPGQVELGLVHGAVVSQVLPRKPDERYDVLANERLVRVHGTRFGVEAAAASLAVQVDEGVVQVLDADGALLAEVRAPQRWVQDGSAQRSRRGTERLPHPRSLALEQLDWPALVVPVWPSVVQWQIDGADIAASDQLQMRVPPGKLPIVGRFADGRSMRGELWVDAMGARFDPSGLRMVPTGTAGAAASASPPALDSESASAVIRASQPALQRCYERSMRGQAPGAASIVRVRLRIEIDARGSVHAVDLADGDATAPPDLTACIRRVARGWRFAAPGGSGVTFEAPLRFRPLH